MAWTKICAAKSAALRISILGRMRREDSETRSAGRSGRNDGGNAYFFPSFSLFIYLFIISDKFILTFVKNIRIVRNKYTNCNYSCMNWRLVFFRKGLGLFRKIFTCKSLNVHNKMILSFYISHLCYSLFVMFYEEKWNYHNKKRICACNK